eukprot:317765_1
MQNQQKNGVHNQKSPSQNLQHRMRPRQIKTHSNINKKHSQLNMKTKPIINNNSRSKSRPMLMDDAPNIDFFSGGSILSDYTKQFMGIGKKKDESSEDDDDESDEEEESINQQQQQQQQIPTSLPRQVSNDSHHSLGSGAASPQSNHSGSSNDKAQTWSKKQQELGDQLYQKVHAKCGRNYAPKITGMLIKMGDKKAQQCIDDPAFLDQQIEIAKKLLETNEGVMPQSNGTTNNQLCVSSPTSMLQQHSSSPTTTTPLMNRLGQQFTNVNSPNGVHTGMNGVNRFQQLNTKPVTPNGVVNSPNSGITNTLTTPNQATLHPQQALLNPSLLTSSIPNLLTSSIPNSLYGAVPILSTPQLLAMSPAPASNTSGTPQPVSNGIHHMNGTTNGNITPNSNHHSKHIQQLNQHVQPQYLFTTMPNSLGIPNGVNVNNINGVVTSPGHQQIYSLTPNGVQVVTTPNSLEQQHQQQQTIQQSGWGLALQQNPQINVIQTQPA